MPSWASSSHHLLFTVSKTTGQDSRQYLDIDVRVCAELENPKAEGMGSKKESNVRGI